MSSIFKTQLFIFDREAQEPSLFTIIHESLTFLSLLKKLKMSVSTRFS